MNTVLITGGAGFIGSHLSDRFIREGWRVIVLDNLLTGTIDNIAHLVDRENFQFIKYNVTNYLFFKDRIDLMLHFACPASPVDYQQHPIHTMKVDSLGTLNTLGLAKNKKSRYVFASTSEIYGTPLVHPQKEDYWGNVNPVGIRAVYDEAKRFSEAMTMAYYREYDIDARIVRIFNTYGTRMRLNDGRVVPSLISNALGGAELPIFGDGEQTRSFCFIDDMVEGIYQLATRDNLAGEVVNLGNPEELTILELAKLILKVSDSRSELVFKPLPGDDPVRRCPNIDRAKKLLDFSPGVPIETGLKRILPWFKEQLHAR